MEAKSPAESVCEMTELVMPQDANYLGRMFGGRLLQMIDIAASMAAVRHARNTVVTVSFDTVHFRQPINIGDAVILKSRVNWVGRTSMEISVEVHSENLKTGQRVLCNSAFVTFVAIDEFNNPVEVPSLKLETDEDRQRFEAGAARREARLQAKKMGLA